MHKLFLSFAIISGLILVAIPVWADADGGNLLISKVLVGDSDSASDEFIELENNTDQPFDATGWCVVYTNATETSKKTLGCLTPPDSQTAVMVPAGGTTLFVSSKLVTKLNLLPDQYTASFSGGMADSSGHVYLVPRGSDDLDLAVDEVDWGLSSSPSEGELPAGDMLMRQFVGGAYQDTGDHNQDFSFAPADNMQYQATTYFQSDLCVNVDGIQTEVPPGDILDDQGNCSPPPVDVCLNIDGVQPVPPPSAAVDGAGNCLPDVCPNLDGLQSVLPDDMEFDQTGACVPMTSAPPSSTSPDEGDQSDAPDDTQPGGESQPESPALTGTLLVNELLPNPAGSDTGNEFIELYNATSTDVVLSDYKLRIIGSSSTTSITLPQITMASGEYLALYNNSLKFTLVNTIGQVGLVRVSDGVTVSESDVYQTATDDMAWVLIDGVWQYSNQPTPGAVNLPTAINPTGTVSAVADLKACAANHYRSPETNRCRLLPVVSTPTPCKDGQYRSEETGRCRSIAVDANTLMPCEPGEERNLDTNRCRKIVATTNGVLTPCKAGQERNPETNRCRNIKSMPDADYSVLAAKTTKSVSYIWWVIAAVIVGAATYAVWEWHEEIMKWLKKLPALVKFRR